MTAPPSESARDWTGDPSTIYHLALVDEWTAAETTGRYDRSTIGRSLADEGYIHASFLGQVAATAERFYAGRDDVVVLTIDANRLAVPVVVEDLFAIGEAFPHVYGPLPITAVVAVTPWADFDAT